MSPQGELLGVFYASDFQGFSFICGNVAGLIANHRPPKPPTS
jgi:hypothetical protein